MIDDLLKKKNTFQVRVKCRKIETKGKFNVFQRGFEFNLFDKISNRKFWLKMLG